MEPSEKNTAQLEKSCKADPLRKNSPIILIFYFKSVSINHFRLVSVVPYLTAGFLLQGGAPQNDFCPP